MKREMGLMYERMLFSGEKGKGMAAGSDTVPVLWLCQDLQWLLQHTSSRLINAAVTTISSPFEEVGGLLEKNPIHDD